MNKFILILAIFLVSCTTVQIEAPAPAEEVLALPEGIPLEELETIENQLSSHKSEFLTSADGFEWSSPNLVAEMASVPELIRLDQAVGPFPEGALLAYFVDGTTPHGQSDHELGLVYSLDDGETWSDRVFVPITGLSSGMVVADPSLVQLEDGSLRLYYFDFGRNMRPDAPSSDPFRFYAAHSTTGLSFDQTAIVFESSTLITDPEVIQFGEEWLLFFPKVMEDKVYVVASTNSLHWSGEATEIPGMHGIPGAYVVDDAIHLFGCSPDWGIDLWTSDDASKFTRTQATNIRACDPSPILFPNGESGMMIKSFDMDAKKPSPMMNPVSMPALPQ